MQQTAAHSSFDRQLRPLLETRSFGRVLRSYEIVDSTNEIATAWALAGAPEGSLVTAEFQHRGRGRLGRKWESNPGLNLTFSLILRPALPAAQFGLITMTACLALARTLPHFAPLVEPEIKWPNDILLNGRKCCGMLLESIVDDESNQRIVVLGVGLNTNQIEFPSEMSDNVTSLRLETGQIIPRALLLAKVLGVMERHYLVLHEDPSSIRREYEIRMKGRGLRVDLRLTDSGHPISGVLAGVTETGAVLIKSGETTAAYHAGEITFR